MGIEHGGVLQVSKYTVVILKLGFSPGGDMDSVAIFGGIYALDACQMLIVEHVRMVCASFERPLQDLDIR